MTAAAITGVEYRRRACTGGSTGSAAHLPPTVVRLTELLEEIRTFKLMSRGEHYKLCHYKHAADGTFDGQLITHNICHEGLKMHRELWRQRFWSPRIVDRVVSHQVGKAFHARLAKILGWALDKMSCTFKHLGNLTSTTIPVNLSRIQRQKSPQKILLAGSGSGISISHIAMEF